MNKSILLLFITLILGNTIIPNVAANTSSASVYSGSSSEAVFVTSVEAQNQQGTKTRWFKIMRTTNANGTYRFYAQDRNGVYDILYADGNNYKPFYVKDENGVRWYFACDNLDRASGRTDQW
ncbi:MAG: hypothetical protein J6L73_09255 [Muribaculaceae bacterium]|nr:hypothetical protein [Muribaculaceae bacterium]